MKVRVPMMVQDPMTAQFKVMEAVEGFDIRREEFFLDGPVTKRVAILDFDPKTNALLPGVPFVPPPPGRVLGRYQIANEDEYRKPDEEEYYEPNFIQVSVFATVLKTMYMFEEEDTLGRSLTWAFDGPQLLVLPRAGQWANAYYERNSHSLQLFYFPHSGGTVYTGLSRDIVAHETGHAILDGIAPDLYNAVTPQSLALHEAVADLTALLMAFRSKTLREAVLRDTEGSIESFTAFSRLAEEFGLARDPEGKTPYLRSLLNEKTLDPNNPECVKRNEPHALSEVLSGALYQVMVNIHESLKSEYAVRDQKDEFSVSGYALSVGANRFKRMIFRALDYLPPGEVSFADYGRAIIAADQASHPDDRQERKWIREEFVRRYMVFDSEDLEVRTNFDDPALKGVDFQTLVESDWAAYEFANRNRELLCIPPDIHLRVRPRLDVTKLYHHRDGEQRVRECLYKVSWDHVEPNKLGPHHPDRRQITVGTTLAIDWDTRRIRALLTSDNSNRPKERDWQQEDRDLMLRRLVDEDILQLGRWASGPYGNPLLSVVAGEVSGGLMRIRRAAQMLHLEGGI